MHFVLLSGLIAKKACGLGLVLLSVLTGRWSGFLLSMAAGILGIIAGAEILAYPLSGAIVIDLIIGTMLVAAGIFRALASAEMRFPNWGLAFLSGIAVLMLGVMLLQHAA